MKVTIRNKAWDFRFVKRLPPDTLGHCDHPQRQAKQIRVLEKLKGKDRLDCVIHELLHAACWDLAEETVDQTATDVAAVLWKLGYRRDGE